MAETDNELFCKLSNNDTADLQVISKNFCFCYVTLLCVREKKKWHNITKKLMLKSSFINENS